MKSCGIRFCIQSYSYCVFFIYMFNILHANNLIVSVDHVTQFNSHNDIHKTNLAQDTKRNSYVASNQEFGTQYEINSWRYFAVIGIMFLILLMLYAIKLKQAKGKKISTITLEQAKILDSKNKIIVIQYNDIQYILGLNPSGITFIDKITLYSQQKASSHMVDINQNTTYQHDILTTSVARNSTHEDLSSHVIRHKDSSIMPTMNHNCNDDTLSVSDTCRTAKSQDFAELLHKR